MKNATSQTRARSVNVKCRIADGNLSIPLQQLGAIAQKELGTGGGAVKAQRGRPRKAAAAGAA